MVSKQIFKFQIHKKKGFVATLSKSVLIGLVLFFFFKDRKLLIDFWLLVKAGAFFTTKKNFKTMYI